ncbi:347_t:CDS:2 [Gigaspora margarita]|uniref:347_t:CDS:1 n=1 Tax=Gigaspora margarita TaxID=4874 RepID=A0ABM8VX13_GIGMA|nr:347_t:CDS:2 [Gigaspora margarita]
MQSCKDVDDEALRWNWKWSCFEERHGKYGEIERNAKIDSEQCKAVPFKIIYPRNGKTYIELNSKPLIVILRNSLPDNRNILKDNPKIDALDLYLVMDELSNVAATLMNHELNENLLLENHSDPKARCHLNHLIQFLKEEHTSEDTDERGKYFKINIMVVDCDGVGFKRCNTTHIIRDFDGQKGFSDLPVVPFRFSNAHNFLKEDILKNGNHFFELALGNRFMHYKGSLMRMRVMNGCMQVEKIRADGRVIIDLQSFATMNPGYKMGNAQPPNKCDIELFCEKGIYLASGEIHHEDNHFLAPAVVYGFSFALKEWGQFKVSEFSDIRFDEDALDHLVISQNKKNMLTGLVRQYSEPNKMTNRDRFVDNGFQLEKTLDPISNKGNGCIFLCYGPPGTGKTLTAECVAEFLRRPLWALTIHELGTDAKGCYIAALLGMYILLEERKGKIVVRIRIREMLYRGNGCLIVLLFLPIWSPSLLYANRLEKQLTKVLDIAHTWRAVLLLDEADIYLEKRDTTNLGRNAMVGVFLRLLEYYQERHGTWTNFIRRADLPLKADDFINYELNGREIRNVIHIARKLARDKGVDLNSDIVIDVIKVIQGFWDEQNEIKIISNGVI